MKNSIESMFIQAQSAEKDMRFSEAIGFYRNILKIRPDHFESWLNLGAINSRMGIHSEAIQIFKQCLEIKVDFRAFFNLGLEFYKIRDYSSSLIYFNKCLNVQSDYMPAFLLSGYSHIENNQLPKAIEILRKGLRICTDKESLLIGLAIAYHSGGNFTECSKVIEQLLELNPENLTALRIKASISLREPMIIDSIELYRKLIQNDPDVSRIDSFINEPKNMETYEKIQNKKKVILEKKVKTKEDYFNLSLVSFFSGNGNAAMNYLLYAIRER